MKKGVFFLFLLATFCAEIVAVVVFAVGAPDLSQDAVAVNEAVQSVQRDWQKLAAYTDTTGLAYVVLDNNGEVLYRTGENLSESLNAAVLHRDTVLDAVADGVTVGKVIFYNNAEAAVTAHKKLSVAVLAAIIALQALAAAAYAYYLHRIVIGPFDKLKAFALRVAGGNLEIPLAMDRQNLFGAFTESFDLMRAELKKARIAESQANESKKELIAKLSHDIKTPVASIKAAAEVGYARAIDAKSRESYAQIVRKADQIDTLVSDLFNATLEELQQLAVKPVDLPGLEVRELLVNADYLRRARLPAMPDCLVYADRLRLQQVFDNIFANSYKYADTAVTVEVAGDEEFLLVAIEDYGGGADEAELPLLTEKFKRGANARDKDGAGLGLYIAAYFMHEMRGTLTVENGAHGLRVTAGIAFSGLS